MAARQATSERRLGSGRRWRPRSASAWLSPMPHRLPRAAGAAGVAPASASEPPSPADKLALEEQRIAEKYKHLEDVLLRMAELSAATDPRRAALLKKAVAQSKDATDRRPLGSARGTAGQGPALPRPGEPNGTRSGPPRALGTVDEREPRKAHREREGPHPRVPQTAQRHHQAAEGHPGPHRRRRRSQATGRRARKSGRQDRRTGQATCGRTKSRRRKAEGGRRKAERRKAEGEKEGGKKGGGGSPPPQQPDQPQSPGPETSRSRPAAHEGGRGQAEGGPAPGRRREAGGGHRRTGTGQGRAGGDSPPTPRGGDRADAGDARSPLPQDARKCRRRSTKAPCGSTRCPRPSGPTTTRSRPAA